MFRLGCHVEPKNPTPREWPARAGVRYLLTAYAKNCVTILVEPRKVTTFFEACACIPIVKLARSYGKSVHTELARLFRRLLTTKQHLPQSNEVFGDTFIDMQWNTAKDGSFQIELPSFL